MIEKKYTTRHGGPYDRGSADAYYNRPKRPHYFEGPSYMSKEITEEDMTLHDLNAYNVGYNECFDRKSPAEY